jgi:acyl-CoA reductase-like NAD-dependent aldehyde dehydrogenase
MTLDSQLSLAPGLYLDGAWSPSSGERTRSISCPADGKEVAVVVEGTAADAEAAVASARKAFDDGGWPRTPERERGQILQRRWTPASASSRQSTTSTTSSPASATTRASPAPTQAG